MNLLGIIETLRRNLRTVVYGCYGGLAVLVLANVAWLLTSHGEPAHAPAAAAHPTPSGALAQESGFWAGFHHLAETVPAFWTLFGLLGVWLLVIVSKTYGHAAVSKPEGYYHE